MELCRILAAGQSCHSFCMNFLFSLWSLRSFYKSTIKSFRFLRFCGTNPSQTVAMLSAEVLNHAVQALLKRSKWGIGIGAKNKMQYLVMFWSVKFLFNPSDWADWLRLQGLTLLCSFFLIEILTGIRFSPIVSLSFVNPPPSSFATCE